MKKYYYENVLANENITAKTNVAWVGDITNIELDQHKKLYVRSVTCLKYLQFTF